VIVATESPISLPTEKPVVVVKKPAVVAGGTGPNYCSFTFTKGASPFYAPKGCTLVAYNDLSFLKEGETSKAFYGCATANSPSLVSDADLARAGLILENDLSEITEIFPGDATFVTFFTNSDFTGYEETFNSRYHKELTRYHFKETDFGNDRIKSIKIVSLTSSYKLPDNCEKTFTI